MFRGDIKLENGVITLIAFFFFLCLILIVENGYILVVLGREWAQCGTLTPVNKILTCLSASRFLLQWGVCGKNLYVLLYPMVFPYNPVHQYLSFHWDFLNSVSLWSSALLGVFYCVKITTFTDPVVLWLKWRISRFVTWLLFGSFGISLFTAFLFFIGNYYIYYIYSVRSLLSENSTMENLRRQLETYYFFPLKVISSSIPAAIFFISMVFLITSLERHKKKMLHSDSGLWDFRFQAHTKALKTLISFFILFASYFFAIMVNASNILPSLKSWYWGWQALIYLCIAIHSMLLILNNPRLLCWRRAA
ncbi:taste receptor type 2 member 60 [Monodelphis domestica]|uniref:Taste receptor type 2 n=1 Tax=Monodelphis domestica TaxID=13616 RepID=Q2AB85_MONDO|nr:taste receptor type 2 member 60 [Monodelphis domestica]BAE80382.1 bitter taste receptor [Monodelphis domestica]